MMPQRLVFALIASLFAAAAWAQQPGYPGGCETLASERPSDAGCYLDAVTPMEDISETVYWHLYTYPTMTAAQAARAKNGTVVQAFHKFWVFTLESKAWRPAHGERVAVIGPLKTKAGVHYTARYIESTLPPGIAAAGHTHSGPEAFYTLSGAQCLETPEGITISRAGESAIVDAGPPMTVSAVGSEFRRGFALVLHDSTQPWMTRAGGWSPSARCPR